MEPDHQVEAVPDGAGLIHIGMPKTGTTALQGALKEARPILESMGVHVAGRKRHEMNIALTAAGAVAPYEGDRWQRHWAELAEAYRTTPARCALWSSESLSQAKPDRIQHIADSLGREPRVVVTLRPLAPLLASQWQEVLRRRGTESLDDWLRRHFDSVSVDGTVNAQWTRVMPVLHRFSLRRVVEEWGTVFGEENLVFVVPAPQDRASNLRTFERLMGVPEGTLVLQDVDNASLPYPEAEMLRHFNRAYTDRGGDHPTWMFSVGGNRGRALLRRMTGLDPHPIRAPRWAAERANEYTQAWIEAVTASRATVVGDLTDLLVDPAEVPEDAPAPTTLSVESAGRLAEVLFHAGLDHNPAPKGVGNERGPARLEDFSGREVVREAGRRIRRRLDPRR
ncbi:hypothetical protein ncot_17505 [Nocardioides sp. JQ2195]|uniref:hypothetical protein n=1 Tax=Nocardioides sp. JQ2195 TaxID=2592334 RepID=UPI00143E88E1|nr:hypothetical protein [Nocardioides sp. JQ2195]QIX28185.1 hypothetical protein ncot_17505 [Nocardioides sp. JQ2195]